VLILIVEDYPDGSEMLAALLEDLGHQARIAGTAEAALALAAERPDVAFVDLLLPDMHGLELATQLRAISPATALVAMTGLAGPENQARAREAGFRHYLLKPYRIEQIEEILGGLSGTGR
jgi:CheY-like chemotaxis protein